MKLFLGKQLLTHFEINNRTMQTYIKITLKIFLLWYALMHFDFYYCHVYWNDLLTSCIQWDIVILTCSCVWKPYYERVGRMGVVLNLCLFMWSRYECPDLILLCICDTMAWELLESRTFSLVLVETCRFLSGNVAERVTTVGGFRRNYKLGWLCIWVRAFSILGASECVCEFVSGIFQTFLNNGVNPVFQMGSTESHNVSLPQNDDGKDSRRQELKEARSKYELEQKTFGLDELQQQLVNIVNVPPMVSLHIKYTSCAHWKVSLIKIPISVLFCFLMFS